MSEPGAIAQSLEEILPGLFRYGVRDERIDWDSEAYALVDRGRVVLIDPLPLVEAELSRLGKVEAILIATAAHQRSAWRLRRATGAPVHAPHGAEGLDEAADVAYGDGERLPGGVRALHAPGPCEAHHVLYWSSGPGILFLTDLVLREPGGRVRFLADDHMSDPSRARRSARHLLEYRFDILCFGHGRPISAKGRAAFEEMLERDGGSRE
jgi:glyoxylase-like metal-dependent hydrolase (beta-lactamase superfamily II)